MEKVTNYIVITKLQMHSEIQAKIRTHTKIKPSLAAHYLGSFVVSHLQRSLQNTAHS